MNNLDTNDSIADFLRLASLKNLYGNRARGRADKQFAEMQNPDLSGTGIMAPQMPVEQNIGNFDVRANQKINFQQPQPVANPENASQPMQNQIEPQNGPRGGADVPAPENLTEDKPWWKALFGIAGVAPASLFGAAGIDANNYLQGKPLNPFPEEISNEPKKEYVSLGNLIPHLLEAQYEEQPPPPIPKDLKKEYVTLANFIPHLLEAQYEEEPRPGIANNEEKITQTSPFIPTEPPYIPRNQREIKAQPQQPTSIENIQQPIQENREPGSYAEPGAVSTVIENPTTKSEIERIFGVSMDPLNTKIAEDYALAMQNYGKSLDELGANVDKNVSDIQQRIESRNLTNQDKLFMAIALIAPAIMSAIIGGKEGLLKSLGGGFKGVSDVLSGRATENKEDQETLRQLQMQKANIGKERLSAQIQDAEFQQKLRKSIPNQDLRDLVNRDGELNEKGELLINTGNPLLPLKSTKIRDIEDYKKFKEKEMPDLEDKIGKVQSSLKLVDQMNNLLDTVDQIEKSGVPGWLRNNTPFNLYDPIAKAFKAYIPASRDTFEDENGNSIKFSEIFNSYREGLMDAQRQFFSGGKNSEHYQEHFFRELPNPFEAKAFLEGKSNLAQTKHQINVMKDRLETAIVNELDAKGIDSQPVKTLFGASHTSKGISENKRKKDRASQAAEQVIRGT